MLKVIKTEAAYEQALERVYQLLQLDLAPDSDEIDELDLLSLLVEHYEHTHYPVAPPNPIDAILFRLDQLGKDTNELGKLLGARSRQSELLSGKRKLSLRMIRKLHDALQIPAESLIKAY